MKWSFDDEHIGLMKKSGSVLSTREIPRPPGYGRRGWYLYAELVCAILNRERDRC